MENEKEIIVISVGGSILVPDHISEKFVEKFKKLIERQIEHGRHFVIIAGGGKTSRHYQNVAKRFKELSSEDIDWIGINATRLNANFLRIIFDQNAHDKIITNPEQDIKMDKPIIVAGGWKPGASTDYVAVLIAKKLGAKKMINLSNVDFLYNTKIMEEGKNITPITDIKWKDFIKLLPEKWDPGLHVPFDPVASREAEKIGLEVAIINGQIIEEFEKYLEGKEFRGTLIS